MDYEKLKQLMFERDEHSIYREDGKWWVSNEWLIGTFAGRTFVADNPDDAVKQMCDYLDKHIGHNSIVGNIVDKSGWPNLDKVKTYLQTEVV